MSTCARRPGWASRNSASQRGSRNSPVVWLAASDRTLAVSARRSAIVASARASASTACLASGYSSRASSVARSPNRPRSKSVTASRRSRLRMRLVTAEAVRSSASAAPWMLPTSIATVKATSSLPESGVAFIAGHSGGVDRRGQPGGDQEHEQRDGEPAERRRAGVAGQLARPGHDRADREREAPPGEAERKALRARGVHGDRARDPQPQQREAQDRHAVEHAERVRAREVRRRRPAGSRP